MIRFSTKNRFLLGFMGLMIGATACTDVDNELGIGFIPDNQKDSVQVDTVGISSYTVATEKFPTGTSSDYGWLGSFNNPVFGNVTSSLAAQYYPASGLSLFKAKVGTAYKNFDSAYLIFKLISGVGDSTANQTLTLYKMLGGIYVSNVYYSNHNFQDSLDATPIGSVIYNRTQNGYVRIPLTQNFVNYILTADTSKLATSDDFLAMFKGIYFKTTGLSSGGSLNRISFADSAAIKINYKLKKVNEPTQDSIATLSLSMMATNTTDNVPLLKVSNISHNYNGTISAADLDGTTSRPYTYIQGLGGLRTKVVFDPSSVSAWENMDYNIHRVELIVPLETKSLQPNATYPNYNTTPNALTAYYQYNADTIMFISDMITYASIPTNAYLNRSTRAYSINITTYFKNAMRKGSKLPRELFLYAGIPATITSSSSSYGYNYLQLPGEFLNFPSWATLQSNVDGKSQVQLVITYSK